MPTFDRQTAYSGTKDVAEPLRFDAGRLEGYLAAEVPSFRGPPAERAKVFDAMNATLAQLHSFEPAAIGLADFGKGENYVARQVDRWTKQYRASQTESVEAMEALMAWLPAHLPPTGPVRIVHGD